MKTTRNDTARPQMKFPQLMIDRRDQMIVLATKFFRDQEDAYSVIVLDVGSCANFEVGDMIEIGTDYVSNYPGSITLSND